MKNKFILVSIDRGVITFILQYFNFLRVLNLLIWDDPHTEFLTFLVVYFYVNIFLSYTDDCYLDFVPLRWGEWTKPPKRWLNKV